MELYNLYLTQTDLDPVWELDIDKCNLEVYTHSSVFFLQMHGNFWFSVLYTRDLQ